MCVYAAFYLAAHLSTPTQQRKRRTTNRFGNGVLKMKIGALQGWMEGWAYPSVQTQ
jgi:hypothetical protein